jgi:hypothetical protein
MSNSNNPTTKKKLLFVTLKLSKELSTSIYSIGLFDQREFCDEFIKTLIYFIENRGLNLYGFVLLSNQVHLIADASNGELIEKIKGLKEMNAKTLIRFLAQKLSSNNQIKNTEHQELRRYFSQFLNSENASVWQKNEPYTELNFDNNQTDLKPLTSQLLLDHLSESNRNYIQLGATAFTKLMMKSMKI